MSSLWAYLLARINMHKSIENVNKHSLYGKNRSG
jgi:hypothetical protein